MPIYQVASDRLVPLAVTNFGAEGIHERGDIQRLLREQIGVLDDRLFVVAEEFGDWLDSSRRIDLLCVDSDANLVVVELKRTEDGGHMELQALRYAAMVSTMTFEQMVDAHARHRAKLSLDPEGAREAVLGFLGWTEPDEGSFGQDTRIILAAADFGKELTTAVMWLLDRDIDIRCVRIRPHRMADGTILIDVQQLIPLPEAASFQTQIGVKRSAERKDRSERHDQRYRFWESLLNYAKGRTQIHANRAPHTETWMAGGIGRAGFQLTYVVRRYDSEAALWLSFAGQPEKHRAAYEALSRQRTEIDGEFGGPLIWQEPNEGDAGRIRFMVEGGYRSPIEEWPATQEKLVDAMIRLDSALRSRVNALQF